MSWSDSSAFYPFNKRRAPFASPGWSSWRVFVPSETMTMEEILCHRVHIPSSVGEVFLVSVFVGDEERDQLVLEQHVFLRSAGRHLHGITYHGLEAESGFACRARAVKATRRLLDQYLESEAPEGGFGSARENGREGERLTMRPAEYPFHGFFLAGEFTAEMQEMMDWTCSPRLRALLVGLLAYRSDPCEAWLLARLFSGAEGARQPLVGR